MTPDLMEQGAQRIQAYQAAHPSKGGSTESGGRAAGFSRLAVPGEVDVTHGRILYLEDVSVSFDGFKAINQLSWILRRANCAASSDPMAPAKPP
jgi:urea transport system ATP-binding protein